MKQAIVLLLFILYALSPFDLIPDWILGPGYLDDLALALFVYLKFFKRTRNAWRTATEGLPGSGRKPESPFNPYQVLGLERGAPKDQICRQYRKLMSQYHPDKVAHLGAELKALAHKKALDIQRAYQVLISDS